MGDPIMRDSHDVHDSTRRTALARFGALLTVLALSGCSTITDMLGSDAEEAPTPTKLENIGSAIEIDTLWSRQAASGDGGRRLELGPAVAGGQVFTAGHKGDIAAYDSLSGERVWEADTGAPLSGGPGAGAGLVVAGSSAGDVIALSDAHGTEAWRAKVSSEVLSAPAVGERIVVVRTVDGKLFGLDTRSGERSWVYDRTVPALTLRGTGAPVIAGDLVVAGFDSGHLAAVSLADGRLVWESQVALPAGRTELERLADIDTDPVVVDGVVYVVTYQGRIAAFDLTTGRGLWRREMSSHTGIAAGQRLLYVTDEQSRVWALDRGSGSSLWRQDGLELRQATRPVEFGQHVVVADFDGYVHWLSAEDGRFVARVRAGGSAVLASPVATQAAVYILDGTGKLTALTRP